MNEPGEFKIFFPKKHNVWPSDLTVIATTYIWVTIALCKCLEHYHLKPFWRITIWTSRDWPKSAPYLRLKNSKRTSKGHSVGESVILLWKKMKKSLTIPKNWKGYPLREKIPDKKVSQCQKKLKEGTLWSRPVLYLRGKPFWFSSLGQGVQFGGFLKFCRTFEVGLFLSLQVYRKKIKYKKHWRKAMTIVDSLLYKSAN